ncbi:hypothetical protein MKQ68_10780 [Chitinophaga horti]|uniref:Uncharacterized protein n=1 Tax=Chitinophaga horti TaxID=2920382 RepID=A0ABY6J7C1_9BACT|nr:hypothetical protein [Chitinophaga horti]UYQ95585.1 hypothetical protein MKQ68_10780 [Chitinophaga horti]
MMKVYIQGAFGNSYKKSKELVKDIGDIFQRIPSEYDKYFDLETALDDTSRRAGIEKTFREYIVPHSETVLTLDSLVKAVERGDIKLLPAVQEELERIIGRAL